MVRGMLKGFRLVMLLTVLLAAAIPGAAVMAETSKTGEQTGNLVYVVPVRQTIESGLQKFMERAFKDAEEHHAAHIILDIDTLGGRVDAALGIGGLVRESKVPTTAYVHGKAISAGSYIALNAGKLVMEPGSSIGAAAIVTQDGKAVEDAKSIAYWTGEMKGAAELNGRNPQIAAKMVDKNLVIDVPELGGVLEKGKLLSLTAEEALKVGYADAKVSSKEDVLSFLGLEGATLHEFEPSWAERLARVLTSPTVMTLLFVVGLAGIAIELFVPGFGVPGILGVSGFALYFFGHYVAGFAGVEDILLFVIGIVLLIIEIFVPGFGIWAVAGIICLMSGVIMAAYDSSRAAASLGVGFALAIVVAGFFIYYFRHKGIWNKFILREELKTELGYVSQESKDRYLGQTGVSLTTLRPAGTVKIGDDRIDVVTEGEYIEARKPIIVVKIEGTRVVVREVIEP